MAHKFQLKCLKSPKLFSFVVWILMLMLVGSLSVKSDEVDVDADVDAGQVGPLVHLPQGLVRGKWDTSRSGLSFKSFLGIPYAKQRQRFGLSYPAEGWRGVLNASAYGPRCAQRNTLEGRTVGVEDCLTINVFSPKVKGDRDHYTHNHNNLLPVMVCLETGGLQFGGADRSGPKYFLDHQVILVTFNYRVSIFGFLSTGDSVVSGNMGLKDQVLALKWVQTNIRHFGGNPRRVTIFGESAGGASVTFHLLSPLSKGLFAQGISQSGSALSSRMFTKDLRPDTQKYARKVGCSESESSQKLVECLRGKTVAELTQALAPEGDILHETTQVFVATLENCGGTKSKCRPFLPDTPSNLVEQGRFQTLPLIMTLTTDEGLLRHSASVIKSPALLSQLNSHFDEVAPMAFHYYKFGLSDEEKRVISRKVRSFYFHKPQNENDGGEMEKISWGNFPNLTACYSDTFINSAVKRHALLHAKYAPVYAAVFNISGIWSQIFELGYKKPLGMGHSDDLQYFFNNDFYPNFPRGSRLEIVSQKLIQMWVNFATFGKPTLGLGIRVDGDGDGGLDWDAVSPGEVSTGVINWQYLGDAPQLPQTQPLAQRLNFWDKIQQLVQNFTNPNTSNSY